MIFSSLVIALLLLADPSTSSCGDCNVYVERVATLSDTTLNVGSTWNIVITEQFARASDYCYYDYDAPSNRSYYTAPDLDWKIEGTSISLRQKEDTLYIEALSTGTSRLFLSASSVSSNDPNVVNQHLSILVK
ncbi:MAG: hypothetical protein JJ895_02115 [Balneolaceae bacterium]|nr:hypothetical protein [Balneolaceae bacterium]